MKLLSITLAALMAVTFVTSPALAGDQLRTRDQAQIDTPTKDQTRDQTGDRSGDCVND